MKFGKASGPDDLTVEHILHAHPILAHLCCLFKAIILHSYMPDDLGLGITVPLVKDKSGELENVSKYRGIILIQIISEVLEGILLGVKSVDL
jgi:hypothetical protein